MSRAAPGWPRCLAKAQRKAPTAGRRHWWLCWWLSGSRGGFVAFQEEPSAQGLQPPTRPGPAQKGKATKAPSRYESFCAFWSSSKASTLAAAVIHGVRRRGASLRQLGTTQHSTAFVNGTLPKTALPPPPLPLTVIPTSSSCRTASHHAVAACRRVSPYNGADKPLQTHRSSAARVRLRHCPS